MPPADAARATARSCGSRAMRLLRPSLVFFLVWGAIDVAMHLLDVGAPTGPRLVGDTTLLRLFLPPGATLPFGPLWFLGVYLVIVAVAPWMIALHRRFRWWVPVAMIAGAICADVIGFQGGVSAGAVVQRRVRVAVAAPARVLLCGRHLRSRAEGGVVGHGGGRARRPGAADQPTVLEALRRRAVPLVHGDRDLSQEPVGHRRRGGVERLPAHRVFPARRDLDDRRRHARATVLCNGGCSTVGPGRRRSPSTR